MVSIRYSLRTSLGVCPHCDGSLFEMSDMWGLFYACEECGYEFDPLELEPKHLQPQGQPTFAGSLRSIGENGSKGRRMAWQVSGAVPGSPLG